MMAEVNDKFLKSNKWGGRVWQRLKSGTLDNPGWERLQQTPFWTSKTQFAALRTFLAGRSDTTTTQIQSLIAKESGSVVHTDMVVDLGSRKMNKPFMCGLPIGLLEVANAKAVVVETDPWEEIPSWMSLVMNFDTKSPVIMLGSHRNVTMLKEIVQDTSFRRGQVCQILALFSDQDLGYGPKPEKSSTFEAHVLVVSPLSTLPDHPGYIVLRGVPVLAEVFSFLLAVAGLQTVAHSRNIVYVPMKGRSVEQCQRLFGSLNARSPSFTYQSGMMGTTGDRTTFLAGLGREATLALQEYGPHSDRILNALWAGQPIDKGLCHMISADPPPTEAQDDQQAEDKAPKSKPKAKPRPKAKGKAVPDTEVEEKTPRKQRTLSQAQDTPPAPHASSSSSAPTSRSPDASDKKDKTDKRARKDPKDDSQTSDRTSTPSTAGEKGAKRRRKDDTLSAVEIPGGINLDNLPCV